MAIDYDYYMEQRQGEQPPEYPEDEPMLYQCTEHESGGVQCEAMLTSPDEEHGHFISQVTIDKHLGRRYW